MALGSPERSGHDHKRGTLPGPSRPMILACTVHSLRSRWTWITKAGRDSPKAFYALSVHAADVPPQRGVQGGGRRRAKDSPKAFHAFSAHVVGMPPQRGVQGCGRRRTKDSSKAFHAFSAHAAGVPPQRGAQGGRRREGQLQGISRILCTRSWRAVQKGGAGGRGKNKGRPQDTARILCARGWRAAQTGGAGGRMDGCGRCGKPWTWPTSLSHV